MMSVVSFLNGILYEPILILFLLGAGLYFTLLTRGIQVRMLGESVRVVMEKPVQPGAISSFQALMVSTASRVGTGNIVGVSSAICLGGYGAVFWMWLIATIGGASAFAESTLAQIYKRKDKNGNGFGGPAYYIESALHNRSLAVIFSVFLILTYAGGFNMLASYNLQSSFAAYSFYSPTLTPWVVGGFLALTIGLCVLGGGQRIVRVTATVVPFMGILYLMIALIVIVMNWRLVPGVFRLIFEEAFDFQAIAGGLSGSALMYGIKRGLFSNEAGVGSAPNASASADVSHPVKQGLVQMLSVFIDTLLLCTATALMCLCSGIAPTETLAGAPYVQAAVSTVFGVAGPVFITVSMVMFAFTTLLGNLFYADNCVAFICKQTPSAKVMLAFRLACVGVIFLGAGLTANAAWDIADLMMALMCLINLPACLVLSPVVFRAAKDYQEQKENGRNPVFKARDIGLDQEQLDFWG